MYFTSVCPDCGSQMRLLDKYKGQNIACPDCGEEYTAGVGEDGSAEDETPQVVNFQQINVQINQGVIPSQPQVRCYCCGLFFDASESTRRRGSLGFSVGADGEKVEHFGDVDTCPDCEHERRAQIAERREAERRSLEAEREAREQFAKVIVWLVCGLVAGAVTIGVPIAALWWFAARYGGRALVFLLLGIFCVVVMGVTIFWTRRMDD